MAVQSLARYNYTYGGGNEPNRQVQFSRTGIGPETIQARVVILAGNGAGAQISIVPGNQIKVEMESTTQKAHKWAQSGKSESLPKQLLSNLSLAQQDSLMRALNSKYVHVENSPGVAGGHEIVTKMKISNLP